MKVTDTKLYQIRTLAGLDLKPWAWRITQSPDNSYTLELTYQEPANNIWFPISTRRASVKTYRALPSLFNDLNKVEKGREAVIFYLGKPPCEF